ncbi:MAG: hypothetical protein J0I88_08705 [Chryseobacterium sp.]|nr:hypothetical protein [Chryseobacterium sp.]OJX33647.1 MAG: hypothetical protein BGO86_15965 [Chryseobacterium sp. 36-9]
MKTKLLLLFSFIFLTSCNGQTKPFGETAINLENFDFATKIADLYPEKYKHPSYKDHYRIPCENGSVLIEKSIIYEKPYDPNSKPLMQVYGQKNWSTGNELAKFGKQFFNKLSFVTDMNNEIKVIGAVADETTEKDNEAFIKNLTKKFGEYKKVESDFAGTFFIYEWRSKDLVYRFATVFNDDKNSIKIEKDKGTISFPKGEENLHTEGYFYIIKSDYIKAIEKLKTNDFVYID